MKAADLLLDSALRGTLLAAGVWLGYLLSRKHSSAAVRHCGLAAALMALAAMPGLIASCEGWKVLPMLPQHESVVAAMPEPTVRLQPRPRDLPVIDRPEFADIAPVMPVSAPPFQWPSWQGWLVGSWALGALAVMTAIGWEVLRLRRLQHGARLCGAGQMLRLAEACAKAVGLKRMPEIRWMDQDCGPLVAGLWRPVVLLPMAMNDWPTERCRAVLLHELAHVKRRDGLVQLFGALTCALHWFNPFAWLLLKHLRHEAECACDDAVLGADMAATNYAEHLLAVASGGRCASSLAPSMARPSGLRQRVQAVLSSTVRRGSLGRLAALAIVGLAAATSLPVMLAQPAEPAKVVAKPEPVKRVVAKPEAPKTTPAKPTAKGTVAVITVDAAGQALGGVELRGFNVGRRAPVLPFKPDFVFKTDDQGHWKGELPTGEFMVLAIKGRLVSYYNRGQTWWRIGPKDSNPDAKMWLEKGGEVAVTVLDAARQAVPNAQLIMDSGHTALTDAAGHALMTSVPMGERVLKVVSPPFADRHVDFNSTGQAKATVEAVLAPGFEVRGRVTNSEGLPVKDAVVRDHYSGKTFHCQMMRCITDADGQYHLGWYPKSKPMWSFGVEHKDYADLSKSNLAPPAEGDTAHWNFVVDVGGEIAGVVKDEAGQPIKGATVRYSADWSHIGARWARSDEQGQFRITKIGPTQPRVVVAEAEGYAPADAQGTPRKGKDVQHLELTMKKGLVVKGRVVDGAGKPVSGVTISPRAKVGGQFEYVGGRIAVDKKGEFQITSLPASGVQLDLYGGGVSDIRHLEVDPTKPVVVTVDKPGVIIGKVVDSVTQKPVKQFNVRLGFPKATKPAGEPSPSYSAHLSRRGQDAQSEDGRFVIEELVTRAAHAVYVSADGYADMSIDKVIARPADDKAWPLEIAMERGIEIQGKLVDAITGDPVAGAKALYVGKDRWWSAPVRSSALADLRDYTAYEDVSVSRSDTAGKVVLHLNGHPTAYSVVITADGYAPQLITNQPVTQTTLQAQPMQREAKLRGTVAGLAGFDPTQGSVTVMTTLYEADQVTVRPDGTFDVAGLPPGKAVIVVRSNSGNDIRGSSIVNLVAGQTTAVDLPGDSRASVKVITKLGGKPVAGAEVWVKLNDWTENVICQLARGVTAEDGSVTLRNLPAVGATAQWFDKLSGQLRSQPVDLTDPTQTAMVIFDQPGK